MTKIRAPSSNFWSTTLDGSINDSVQTITLSSTTGLEAPGYLIIDREDSSGTATPSSREVIYYTGISSNDLTGVTRGSDGSTARSHSDGALTESTMTIGMFNGLASAQIMGTATITTLTSTTGTIGTVKTDTVSESTNGVGVLVDSVLLKDGGATITPLSTATIFESASDVGVNIDGLSIKDGKLNTNSSVVTANITDANITSRKMAPTYKTDTMAADFVTGTTGGFVNVTGLVASFSAAEIPVDGVILAWVTGEVKHTTADQNVIMGITINGGNPDMYTTETVAKNGGTVSLSPIATQVVTGGSAATVQAVVYQSSATLTVEGATDRSRLLALYFAT